MHSIDDSGMSKAIGLLLGAREAVLAEGRLQASSKDKSKKEVNKIRPLFMIYEASGGNELFISKNNLHFIEDVLVARMQWESMPPETLGVDLIVKVESENNLIHEPVKKVWGCTPYSKTIVETTNYKLTLLPQKSSNTQVKPLLIYVDERYLNNDSGLKEEFSI